MSDARTKVAGDIVKAIERDIDGRSGGDEFLYSIEEDIRAEMFEAWQRKVLKVLDGYELTPRGKP